MEAAHQIRQPPEPHPAQSRARMPLYLGATNTMYTVSTMYPVSTINPGCYDVPRLLRCTAQATTVGAAAGDVHPKEQVTRYYYCPGGRCSTNSLAAIVTSPRVARRYKGASPSSSFEYICARVVLSTPMSSSCKHRTQASKHAVFRRTEKPPRAPLAMPSPGTASAT